MSASPLFILFATILIVYLKCPKLKGLSCLIYAYGYAIMRFTLEFFRYDAERGLFLGLSTSQWISIIIFVVATACLIYNIVKKQKSKKKEVA